MSKTKIRRPVVTLNRDRQFGLFEELAPTSTPPDGGDCVSPPSFIDPDPREILIGTSSLEAHLKAVGNRDAFVVRRVLRELDFTVFEQAYSVRGRSAYAPKAMTGLVLYGLMHGVSSLRDLERLAQLDLGCMWVSGGIMPDHSILGRFIQRHSQALKEVLFGEVVVATLHHTQSSGTQVAGDGTVIEAMSSRYGLLHKEAAQQRLQTLSEQPQHSAADAAEQQRLRKMVEVLEDRQADNGGRGHETLNPLEPEAVVLKQKGSTSKRPSYVPSVLANDERVVVDAELASSGEVGSMQTMVDRNEAIEELMLDAGYRAEGLLESAVDRDIDLLVPASGGEPGSATKPTKYFSLQHFRYDEARDVYHCPAGERLKARAKYRKEKRVRYTSTACRRCPLKSQCTKGKQRLIERTRAAELKEGLQRVMDQPKAALRYRQRKAMVEPVFAALRDRQGLRRFRRKGKHNVQVEFSLHIMAYNLSRIVARLRRSFLRHLARRMSLYGPICRTGNRLWRSTSMASFITAIDKRRLHLTTIDQCRVEVAI